MQCLSPKQEGAKGAFLFKHRGRQLARGVYAGSNRESNAGGHHAFLVVAQLERLDSLRAMA
ncbi:hypothetical protein GCM10022421_24250 [Oceanisphaera sediminis]|uniref:Uncharacterized protein n=1 Tax=Oceanisphaera sediminis TaxID=981381 RepID=A0ABP7E8J6_9GAMM